ncbi:MAG: TonB-dependent receptor [Cytophagales bacterium]|nr:TonB-dependent receptor [Cytophagales bacterium]
MRKMILYAVISALSTTAVVSQEMTQTVRGTIVDEVTEYPLIGATIKIIGSDPLIGAVGDFDGNFRIENVPAGRHTFQIAFIGYEEVVLSDILVHTGKSTSLNIRMQESMLAMEQVVVVGTRPKDLPINEMASVSARSFSVEETRRYAGGLDDPGRMVSAFAGVTSTSLGENAIIIRGNAPKGVQYRMEGIEIPNPSHFGGATVSGGGFVTLLSNQVLANSDFLTGAFPSEYGNALSGVFDMNLRTGNRDEAEHTFQAGLLGLDIASEGPFKKGGTSSYLFNYRYSTLGLIEPVLPDEANSIRYQDLSYKLNFPTEKAGEFSVWGIGGKDYGRKNEEPLTDPSKWENEDHRQDYEYGFFVGATGLRHKINFGEKSMLQTNIVASVNDAYWDVDRLDNALTLVPDTRVDNLTGQYSFSTSLNHKFSKRHANKTGLTLHRQFFTILISESPGNQPPLQTSVDQDGTTNRMQAFTQSKFRLSEGVTVNVGVHSQYFALTDQTTLEPRAGIQVQPNYKHTFSLGYGNHSQVEDAKIYFVQSPSGEILNGDLKLSRAHHFVFSYDWLIAESVRLKIEPYYQQLYEVPVAADSSFSMLNYSQDWFLTQELVNEGKGRNYGLDLTLERFLKDNFYYLVTGSVFTSEYKGGDKVWRNTRYDRGYSFNILAGKEWEVGANDNKRLGLNVRMNMMGGLRYSPVDEAASVAAEEVMFDEYNAYDYKSPAVNYLDFTITYRKNKPNKSTVWALQIKNLLGNEDFDGYGYNYAEGKTEEIRSVVMIPNLTYKIEF